MYVVNIYYNDNFSHCNRKILLLIKMEISVKWVWERKYWNPEEKKKFLILKIQKVIIKTNVWLRNLKIKLKKKGIIYRGHLAVRREETNLRMTVHLGQHRALCGKLSEMAKNCYSRWNHKDAFYLCLSLLLGQTLKSWFKMESVHYRNNEELII